MARITVFGESLLDIDLNGQTQRLCPDSPAMVVDEIAEQPRAGGAALAANVLARLGHHVLLVTPLNDDLGAEQIRDALSPRVEIVSLPQNGATPTKRRVRASGQTLLRLDAGGDAAPWSEIPLQVAEALIDSDAVLVSDYGRGLTKDVLARRLLSECGSQLPLIWDPHPRGGEPVTQTLLMTPNEAELTNAARAADWRSVAVAAARTKQALGVGAVAVTMGSKGALLSYGTDVPQFFSTRSVTGDPCGAGDCFAASAAAAIAEGELLPEAVRRAVAAATRHVENGGAAAFNVEPAPMSETDVFAVTRRAKETGQTIVATGGCFDLLHAGHVAMLEAAAQLGDKLIVCLNSDESIRRIKGTGRPLTPVADRKRVLESLHCVDAVEVFDDDTPVGVLRRLKPHIWAKGGDYSGTELPEAAVLAEWGGQALILPYLEGRSTTRLVNSMSA